MRLISGLLPETTNNRAELTAVIEGLACLRLPSQVTLRTDSWICIWALEAAHVPKKRARYEKKGKNMDLVRRLWAVAEKHRVMSVWVRGHAGDPDNEACDAECARLIRAESAKRD